MEFNSEYNSLLEIINSSLNEYITENDSLYNKVNVSMRYSLLAGGKRLRPVLALATTKMLGGDVNEILPFACAIEMIHTYSLIHDDLPAMDNDDYRRGKLTNHKVFGEDIAILSGDGLLNLAFETMSLSCLEDKERIINRVKALNYIANSSGVNGMVGGQVIDLESEGKKINLDLLKQMHKLKTGALIKAPVIASAIIMDVSDERMKALDVFSSLLGLAFQIKDDLLDIEGDFDSLGKPIGSDNLNEKATFVTINGIEKSKEYLIELTNDSIKSLNMFGEKAEFLEKLAYNLVNRTN